MKIKGIYFYMVVSVSILASGCVADQHAQDLSKEILIQVVEYDNAVQGMSIKLKDNYENRMKRIQKGSFIVGKATIETTIDRLAVEVVDNVVLRGYLTSDLRNYLNTLLEAKRIKELQYEAALASYKAKHQALLNKLILEQKELKGIKSSLNTLQNAESSQEQIQRLVPLLQAAYEAQKKTMETEVLAPANN